MSRRQVEDLVARLRRLPPVAASIRKLPVPEPADNTLRESLSFDLTPPPDTGLALASSGSRETAAAGTSVAAISRPAHRAVILPLAPEYYRLQVTLRVGTHARLRQAQGLMRHQITNGDPASRAR